MGYWRCDHAIVNDFRFADLSPGSEQLKNRYHVIGNA